MKVFDATRLMFGLVILTVVIFFLALSHLHKKKPDPPRARDGNVSGFVSDVHDVHLDEAKRQTAWYLGSPWYYDVANAPEGQPPPAPDDHSCLAELRRWSSTYDQEVRMFEAATRSGFASPGFFRQEGAALLFDGDIDWHHPVGFAVIDCDRKGYLIDGKTSATISWDASRKCLVVHEMKAVAPPKN